MIAEVYPIQRLPRRFSVFDYLVPADLTLLPGSMVRVPFRHEELTGIVRRVGVKRVTMDRLKAVRALANAVQLAPEEIAWYEEVARETAQSVSSVLHAAFPPVPRRAKAAEPPPTHLASLTVKVSEAPRILQLLERVQRHRTAFVQAADLVQMAAVVAAYLHANARERVAVLVPHVRDARLLAPYLGFAGLSLMTGEESLGRRYAAWEGFRSRKTRVFLGTRIVSLLLPPGVETIFVLRSGHPDHKQADQNPRYDARGNARRYQAQSGCRLYFFDVVPRPDDLIAFGSDQVFVRHPAASAPVLVDLGRERAASPHPRVSYTLSQFLEEHFKAGMRTVCFYNRKGTARALRCHDCARTFPCPGCGSVLTVYETSVRCHSCAYAEPIPLSCEVCGGTRLVEQGFGNRAIQQAIQRLLPQASVALVEQKAVGDVSADVVIATSHFLESLWDPFKKNQRIGGVALLDADLPFHEPTFRALEQGIRQCEEAGGMAERLGVPFLVQTHVPEVFQRFYQDPLSFYLSVAETRKAYGYPPFSRRMTLTCRTDDPRRTRLELDAAAADLRQMAGARVDLASRTRDREARLSLALSVQLEAVDAVLTFLRTLPDHIVIDTNVDG